MREVDYSCLRLVLAIPWRCAGQPSSGLGESFSCASVRRDVKPVALDQTADRQLYRRRRRRHGRLTADRSDGRSCRWRAASSVRSGIKADYDRSGADVAKPGVGVSCRRLERRRLTSTTVVDRSRLDACRVDCGTPWYSGSGLASHPRIRRLCPFGTGTNCS